MQKLKVESNYLTESPDYKLYSSGQMTVATILCSIVSGGLLLASNYSKLGDRKKARQAIYLTIAVFTVQLIINVILDIRFNSGGVLLMGLNVGIAFGFGFMVDKWHAAQYAAHRSQGGMRNSNLNAATLCLFASLSIFLALLGLFLLISFAVFFGT